MSSAPTGGRSTRGSTRLDTATLVRAPRWLVHRRLSDVDDWPTWWPDLQCFQRLRNGDHWVHHLEVTATRPWRPRHRLRVAVMPYGHRPDTGMRLLVVGDVRADVEFWFEDVRGDTLVHHLATVTGPDVDARHWQGVVGRGLWALADRLADEVRRAVLVDAGGDPASPPPRPLGTVAATAT